MKRNLIGAIVLIAALAFAGCDNNGSQKNDTMTENQPTPKQMLIIVDPQVDFTTGSLATAKGPEAMDFLAQNIKNGVWQKYSCIIVTQDAHPQNHCSFVEQGGVFPPHCVQGTKGMEVYPALKKALKKLPSDYNIQYLQKGNLADKEEFSIFQNKESGEHLRELIRNSQFECIDICGIATDYCVYETAKDLLGIYPANKVRIITNCLAAVDDNDTKLADMIKEKGLQAITY